jgi:hypothetical protein
VGGKQVVFVFAALVVLGIAALVFRFISAEPDEILLTGVAPLAEETLDKVVIRNNEFETVIEKVDGDWQVGPYPVQRRRFEDMWATTALFDEAELIAQNPENHPLMGVSPENGTLVEFWNQGDLVEEFFVGDQQFAPIGERLITPWQNFVRLCYLRNPEEDDVYGIFCDFPDRFLPDPKFWKHPLITEIPRDEVESISFRYPEEDFSLRIENSVWIVSQGGAEVGQADPEKMLELLQAVEYLVTSDFPTDDELNRLNFDLADITMFIQVRTGAISRSARLLLLERDEGGYFVKRQGQDYAFIIDDQVAPFILKRIADLIPPPPETSTETSTSTP